MDPRSSPSPPPCEVVTGRYHRSLDFTFCNGIDQQAIIDDFVRALETIPEEIASRSGSLQSQKSVLTDDKDCFTQDPSVITEGAQQSITPVVTDDTAHHVDVSSPRLFTPEKNTLISDFLSYSEKVVAHALVVTRTSPPVSSRAGLNGYRFCLSDPDTFTAVTCDMRFTGEERVSSYCSVLPELDYLAHATDERVLAPKSIKTSLTLAGPGCGKTYSLVQLVLTMVACDVIVFTTTKASASHLRSKFDGCQTKGAYRLNKPRVRVYTLDAYVINHSHESASVVVIDECFLSHPGKLFMCIALTGAKTCHFFGDALQIPFIDRENLLKRVPNLMDTLAVTDVLTRSYRCPGDVCDTLSHFYYSKLLGSYDVPVGLWSPLRVDRPTVSVVEYVSLANIDLSGYDIVLTFTQKEKQHVSAFHLGKVQTVHEYQGCEADNVAVVRYYDDFVEDHIFTSDAHCIVAMSRHRKRMVYFTRTTENDTLAHLIRDTISRHHAGGAITRLANPHSLGIYKPPPRPVAAVPFNRETFKFYAGTDRVYVCTGKTNGRDAKFDGRKMIFHNARHFDSRKLSEVLSYFRHKLDGKSVTIKFSTFPHIDQGKVVKIFNRNGVRFVDFSSAADFIGFNTYDAAIASALGHDAKPYELFSPEVCVGITNHTFEIGYNGDYVRDIQWFLAHFFPSATFVNTEFDQYSFHRTEITFPISKLSLSRISGHYLASRYDCMRPVISSPCPRTQAATARNALHSIAKRNANIPVLASIEDIPTQVNDMVNMMFRLCPTLRTDYLAVTSDSIEEWLSSQPMSVGARIIPDRPIYDCPLSVYDFALKKSPKPDLSQECLDVYPAVQTILHQEKYVNAVFCPIWNEIRDRVVTSMDSRFKFMTLCDDISFGRDISKILPPSAAAFCNALEFDMSKFDKSQGALILEFECALMRRMGVPDEFVDMWYNGHVVCQVRDHACKISFRTIYQRKSGDASTYTGNTIALMVMLLDMLDVDQIQMALFSGDDSLIFTTQPVELINFNLSGYRYNLECKLFDFNSKYFCSKFLVPYRDEWLIVPDPLKRAVKLGRHDLRNPEHIELYRISFNDNIRSYTLVPVHYMISDALVERYSPTGRYFDCSSALLAMVHVSREPALFQTLFYSNPDDVICKDPNLPTLDL